jgi:hypothetical protein
MTSHYHVYPVPWLVALCSQRSCIGTKIDPVRAFPVHGKAPENLTRQPRGHGASHRLSDRRQEIEGTIKVSEVRALLPFHPSVGL